jgi:hypothetical protein
MHNDSKWLIPSLIVILGFPYLILFVRLVRILTFEAGASENPYPGSEDPIGPEFAFPLFLLSIAVSILPILISRKTLRTKALILLAVTAVHVVGYPMFIVFAFACAGVVTGRSV